MASFQCAGRCFSFSVHTVHHKIVGDVTVAETTRQSNEEDRVCPASEAETGKKKKLVPCDAADQNKQNPCVEQWADT